MALRVLPKNTPRLRWPDSNPQPLDHKTNALTTELSFYKKIKSKTTIRVLKCSVLCICLLCISQACYNEKKKKKKEKVHPLLTRLAGCLWWKPKPSRILPLFSYCTYFLQLSLPGIERCKFCCINTTTLWSIKGLILSVMGPGERLSVRCVTGKQFGFTFTVQTAQLWVVVLCSLLVCKTLTKCSTSFMPVQQQMDNTIVILKVILSRLKPQAEYVLWLCRWTTVRI